MAGHSPVPVRGAAMAVLGLVLLAGAAGALPLPPLLMSLERVAQVPYAGGGGLWIEDGLAYSSGLNGGFFVTDVSDPEHPAKLGQVTGAFMRDAAVLHTQGRTIAVSASDSGGMRFLDATEPAQLSLVSTLKPANVHNVAVIPGTTLVYNSRGGGGGNSVRIDIVDAAAPEAPVLVKTWASPSTVNGAAVRSGHCHDIEIRIQSHRAYCAGGAQTLILDIADPLEPVLLGAVPENRFISFHHWAVPSNDERVLIVGDEDFSTSPTDLLPNCSAGLATPVGSATLTQGAIWFYDITDPATPVLQGWFSAAPQAQSGTCTAHFGEVLPEGNVVAAAWYRGGITLVDFSVPALPRLLAAYETDTNDWDVRYADGYLFTGDINHGMDVLRINPGP